MVYEIDIVSRINQAFIELRKSEKKIAQMILDDIDFSAHASISELAERAEVSEATITRFAKAIGCKNVRELKLRLAQSLAVGKRFISESEPDPKLGWEQGGVHSVYEVITSALGHNARLITPDLISPASELICKARQVLIFGVGGGSTVMAQECQYRLFRLGIAATAYSDPMLMRMVASTIDQGDVIICLSLGGYSPDVQEAAEIAMQYGAGSIAITKDGTPLATCGDVLIPIEPLETDYIFQPSASRYVMMAAIDVLATDVAVKHKRKSRENLRRLKHNLDSHKHGDDRLPLGD